MVFENNKVTNNAETTLFSTISASATSLIVNTGEGAIFPTTFPFKLTLEKFSGVNVIKREIVKVTNRVGDAFTIVRGNEACVQDDTANPKTLTSNGLQFDSGDKVSLYNTAGNETDIKTEVARLETDKLNKSDYANSNALYSASSTGNDDYVITIPNLTAYTDGAVFRFKADVANIGPATLNINGLGTIPLKKLQGTVDLVDGDIKINGIVTAVYNSTGPVFQFTSQNALLAIPPEMVFGDGSDGDLILNGTNNILNVNQVYNFNNLTIPTGQTLTLNGQGNLIIHCKGTVDISGIIDVSSSGYGGTITTNLEILGMSIVSGNGGVAGNGGAGTYYNGVGGLGNNSYGGGGGAGGGYYGSARYGGAGGVGGSPAGLGGTPNGGNAYGNNGGDGYYAATYPGSGGVGGNSSGGGGASFNGQILAGGGGAGGIAGNNGSNIIIISNNIIGNGSIITNGGAGGVGGAGGAGYALNGTAGNGGGGGGGGGGAGGGCLIIYKTSTLSETFTANGGTGAVGGAGNGGSVAGGAGGAGGVGQIIKKQLYTLI